MSLRPTLAELAARRKAKLDRLATLLRKRACTALEIAARLGCSVPTAYQYALEVGAHTVVTDQRRPGITGPRPVAFRL